MLSSFFLNFPLMSKISFSFSFFIIFLVLKYHNLMTDHPKKKHRKKNSHKKIAPLLPHLSSLFLTPFKHKLHNNNNNKFFYFSFFKKKSTVPLFFFSRVTTVHICVTKSWVLSTTSFYFSHYHGVLFSYTILYKSDFRSVHIKQ